MAFNLCFRSGELSGHTVLNSIVKSWDKTAICGYQSAIKHRRVQNLLVHAQSTKISWNKLPPPPTPTVSTFSCSSILSAICSWPGFETPNPPSLHADYQKTVFTQHNCCTDWFTHSLRYVSSRDNSRPTDCTYRLFPRNMTVALR